MSHLEAEQYEYERRTFAQDLIDFDKRWTEVVENSKPLQDEDDVRAADEERSRCIGPNL